MRGVSLDIRSGEFLTLLGPSGSGKTTTLMMIAGFETPTRGDIAIDGTSVVALPPHRRNIGMVFQNYALFPHLTVAENIGFPLKQRGVDRGGARQAGRRGLELVHLPGYGARYPRQLSGGQQQRVALARAIVFQPRLLLMDEPLGALDKQLRESLQLEMRRLHADLGITFIYVTHDQEEALTMSDRIAVMNEGLIAQVGRRRTCTTGRAIASSRRSSASSNFLPGVVRGLEDGVVVADCGGAIIRAVWPGRPCRAATGDADDAARAPALRRWRLADATARAEPPAATTVTETVFAGERCRYLLQAGDGGVRSSSRSRPAPRSAGAPSASGSRSPGRSPTRSLSEACEPSPRHRLWPRAAAGARFAWRRAVPVLLVAPLVLYMVVFYALPLVSMLLRSVADPTWTLENYRGLADDAVFLKVFWTTLLHRPDRHPRQRCCSAIPWRSHWCARRALGAAHPDPGPAAVLDQRAGAQLRLDGAAGPPRPDQRGADRHRPDRPAAAPAEHARSPCTSR